MATYILPYKTGSRSSRVLAGALGVRRIRRNGSTLKCSKTTTVVNWGSCDEPVDLSYAGLVLNHPRNVRDSVNKRKAFEILYELGVRSVPFTTDRSTAQEKWVGEGCTVVARTHLRASGGKGIIIVSEGELPKAPLYTRYIPKKDEYRVHVVGGKVVDVQRKMRKKDVPDNEVNWKVRNVAGGFVFGREGVDPSWDILDQSIRAVEALGLQFGAVDVLWNEAGGRAYVLEVNTAPGLEGSSIDVYVSAINEYLDYAGVA